MKRKQVSRPSRASLSFLKWAGGKRWLLDLRPDFFDVAYVRYIEPFLGGGSVFFAMHPNCAILSDANAELIECYRVMRENPSELLDALNAHARKHCRDHYYKTRSSMCPDIIERAAKFIYLNRTCFNGLYRVNASGSFNVPIGTKNNVILPTDDFEKTSERLKSATLNSCDFEKTIDMAEEGDLVYIDPPYTANHNKNGFLKYNERIFSWDDQVRLKESAIRAATRGAHVIVSNAAHHSVIELYSPIADVTTVSRNSVLAADRSKRGAVEEIVAVIRT